MHTLDFNMFSICCCLVCTETRTDHCPADSLTLPLTQLGTQSAGNLCKLIRIKFSAVFWASITHFFTTLDSQDLTPSCMNEMNIKTISPEARQ